MAFIDPEDNKNLEYLLKPEFDWKALEFESLVGIGQEAVSSRKILQRLLGRLAIALEDHHVEQKEFAKEIGVSANTLRSYKKVEKTFDGLDIPADINYGALWVIAQQENPREIMQHVLEDGLSSAEIIKAYKQKIPKKKEIVCPHCNSHIVLSGV